MSNIKEKQKRAWQGMFYYVKIIDISNVIICCTGIYVCLDTMKYLLDTGQEINMLFKVSGTLFSLSIIVKFVSQSFAYRANRNDYLTSEAEIDISNDVSNDIGVDIGNNGDDKKTIDIMKELINEYDKKADKHFKISVSFHALSMSFMLAGLILLIYSFWNTVWHGF